MNQEQFSNLITSLTQVNNYISVQCASHKHCTGCPLVITTSTSTVHLCDIGDLTDDKIVQLVQLMNQRPTNTRLSMLLDQYPKTALNHKTQLPYFCYESQYMQPCPQNLLYNMNCEQCQRCWLSPVE